MSEIIDVMVSEELFVKQDAVLRGIADGRLDQDALASLPAWRAVLLARIACKAGVMKRADRDRLIRQAHLGSER